MPGLGAAGSGRGGGTRLAAEEGDKLAAGTGWAGPPNRVAGEQTSPVHGVMSSGAIGSKTGRQARRDRLAGAARDRDVPAIDGDLDGSGHLDHARGQLAVPDGDPPLGWPVSGAGARQAGGLAAQARDGVRSGPGLAGRRCAGASGGSRLVRYPDRVADMIRQRFQVPARAQSGALQERRSDQRGTGERVTDS